MQRSSIGIKVSLLPLGPSCPLQTILLSDLVWCGSPPANRNGRLAHSFLKFEAQQTAILDCRRLLHLARQFKNLKKCAKLTLLSAAGCHTPLDGQHCPLRKYQSVFLKGRKTL
jgi:hypothetical protein